MICIVLIPFKCRVPLLLHIWDLVVSILSNTKQYFDSHAIIFNKEKFDMQFTDKIIVAAREYL